jgi:site-specific recombinase XerD
MACRGRDLRGSTLESYSKTLSHLDAATSLESVDPTFLDAHRSQRKIAAGTWRKELETLRAFFAWCVERGWITDNPARRLRMPRVQELSTLPFTPAEVTKLLDACDHISSGNPAETHTFGPVGADKTAEAAYH